MTDMSYNWQPAPHTADLAIAISATDHAGLFYAALEGLLGSLDIETSDPGERKTTQYKLAIKSHGIEAALVDFLNECVYVMEVEDLIPFRISELAYDDDSLDAVLTCRPVTPTEAPEIGHIKAATYSDLEVQSVGGSFQAKIVFDT